MKKSEKENFFKKLSATPLRFISDFVNDTAEKKQAAEATSTIFRQLQLASLQKSYVILQLEAPKKNKKFRTVSGWLPSHVKGETFMLKTTDQQLLMLNLADVKKVTTRLDSDDQKTFSR